MKVNALILSVVILFICGCASTGFPPQTAKETAKIPADKGIEISLAPGSFDVGEVEFHVNAESIPVSILKRAKEEMPEGVIDDCEIEYHGGDKYYEVTMVVKGKEQEAMFTEAGKVHRWEVEIAPMEVPPMVVKTAESVLKGAEMKKAEQILDKGWNVQEYHFKMEKEGVKYKVIVSLGADRVQVFRETVAEIEVPIR
jgi:hypothetical protein